MRILIAEDDESLAAALMSSLHRMGYVVDCVRTGEEANRATASVEFNLIILDIGLPKMNGLEVLKRLRARESNVPVLILTALDRVQDRVRGLDLGADDYLSKPFALNEMEARVRALTRRGHAGSATLMRHGDLTFDRVGKVAEIHGVTLDLSAREIALLEIFLQRVGRIVSKELLVEHLCEWGEEVSANAIEVYVHRLRRKLGAGGVEIVTVRGLGYRIEKDSSS
ncbi:MAG: response regulator transcription factor [Pseudomonadota bacterium]